MTGTYHVPENSNIGPVYNLPEKKEERASAWYSRAIRETKRQLRKHPRWTIHQEFGESYEFAIHSMAARIHETELKDRIRREVELNQLEKSAASFFK